MQCLMHLLNYFMDILQKLAPVFSSCGTIVAIAGLAVEVKKHRKDEQLFQAKKISCWIESDNFLREDPETRIAILNDSNLPIYDVIVSIDDVLSSQISTGDERCSYCSIIPSGCYLVSTHPIDPYMNHIFNASITFRDSQGRSWVRNAKGELSEIRKKTIFSLREITLPPTESSKKRLYQEPLQME